MQVEGDSQEYDAVSSLGKLPRGARDLFCGRGGALIGCSYRNQVKGRACIDHDNGLSISE